MRSSPESLQVTPSETKPAPAPALGLLVERRRKRQEVLSNLPEITAETLDEIIENRLGKLLSIDTQGIQALTAEENRVLLEGMWAVQDSDPALAAQYREEVILGNLPFAVEVAKKRGYTLPLMDRVQMGAEALCLAVDGFQPDRNFTFSTYAHEVMIKHIDTGGEGYGRLVRVRSRDKLLLKRITFIKKFLEAAEESVEAETIYNQLIKDLKKAEITEKSRASWLKFVTVEKVLYLLQYIEQEELGLEDEISFRKINSDENLVLMDFIPDVASTSTAAEANLTQEKQADLINEVLATIPPLERRILEFQWGLNGQVISTDEEIIEQLNIQDKRRYGLLKERANDRFRHNLRKIAPDLVKYFAA